MSQNMKPGGTRWTSNHGTEHSEESLDHVVNLSNIYLIIIDIQTLSKPVNLNLLLCFIFIY